MKRLKNFSLATVGVAFAALGTVSHAPAASAISLTIQNYDFESPSATQQSDRQYYSINDITSWSTSGSAGVFDPDRSSISTGIQFFNSPHGSQTAYIDSGSGSISQQLSDTLVAGATYTLSVDVGQRNDRALPGYNVELLAGNTVLASNNSVTPGAGNFAPLSFNYTANASDPLGQALGIRLSSLGGGQVNFDNVSLDATAVPFEFTPTIGLLILGTCAVGFQLKNKLRISTKF